MSSNNTTPTFTPQQICNKIFYNCIESYRNHNFDTRHGRILLKTQNQKCIFDYKQCVKQIVKSLKS